MESLQSRTYGTFESLEHLPGHPLGKSQGLYGRGSNEFVDVPFGPRSASIGRLSWQMTDGSAPMRSSMGAACRCHYCNFSSRPTTECRDNARVIPVPAYFIS